jgi:hypothetical protein
MNIALMMTYSMTPMTSSRGNYFIRTRGSDGCISNSKNNVELFQIDLPNFDIQMPSGNLVSITITNTSRDE